MLSGLLLLGGPGLANDRTSLGEQTESSADAVRKAYAWSFDVLPENDDMPGIAVLIAYGTGNGMPVEEVGGAFVNELHQGGYKARYFYYLADWQGVSVEYRIGFSVRGPWNVPEAAGNMSEMTELARGAQNVHKPIKSDGA